MDPFWFLVNKSFPEHLLTSLYPLGTHLLKLMRNVPQGTFQTFALVAICQCKESSLDSFRVTRANPKWTPSLLVLIILQDSTQQKRKYLAFCSLSTEQSTYIFLSASGYTAPRVRWTPYSCLASFGSLCGSVPPTHSFRKKTVILQLPQRTQIVN